MRPDDGEIRSHSQAARAAIEKIEDFLISSLLKEIDVIVYQKQRTRFQPLASNR